MIYLTKLFTSDLSIMSEKDFDQKILIEYLKAKIEDQWSYFNQDSSVNRINRLYCSIEDSIEDSIKRYNIFKDLLIEEKTLLEELNDENISIDEFLKFSNYDPSKGFDCTGLLKGYSLKLIMKYFFHNDIKHFIINFGGDGISYNYSDDIVIDDGKLKHCYPKGSVISFFTSVNSSKKRLNHIKGDGCPRQITLLSTSQNLITLDMVSTLLCSGGVSTNIPFDLKDVEVFEYNKVSDIENVIKIQI